MTTMNIHDLPSLSNAAASRLAAARADIERLLPVLLSKQHVFWVLIAITVILVLIDVGLGYLFNTAVAPSSDPSQPVTLADDLARAAAAVMMVVSLSAAVFVGSKAFDSGVDVWRRSAALGAALVFIVGATMLAAGIAWPVFQSATESVLIGTSPPPTGMAGAEPRAESASVPLAARLLSATPILAIGILAGVLELIAVGIWRAMRQLRSAIGLRLALIELAERANQAYKRCIEHSGQVISLGSPQALRPLLIAGVNRALAQYGAELGRQVPDAVEPARESPVRHANRQEQRVRHRQRIDAVENLRREGVLARRLVAFMSDSNPVAASHIHSDAALHSAPSPIQ